MLVAVLVLLTVTVSAVLSAGDDGKKEEESVLHQQMEKIERGLKRLRRDVKDPAKNASSLEIVAGIEAAALECKLQVPPLAAKKPEAERAAFVRDYRKTLAGVVKDMLD